MLKHLDLFSGIGGFALAARWAGMETIGFSEIDPYASQILKRHWPSVPNYGDIRNVRGVRADLLTGGFPCQPFSKAGKRRGKNDDRYLWPEMLRIIEDARPAWVLGENVPGIVSVALDDVLAGMEARGYACRTFIIPACGVDAPHWRERVWMVANADDGRCLHGWAEIFATVGREFDERKSFAGGFNVDIQRSIFDGEAKTWPAEPGVGRVAHGVSRRVDRLRGLGNAIVPAIAFRFLKTIADLEARAEQANVEVCRGALAVVKQIRAVLTTSACGDCDPCLGGRPDQCALSPSPNSEYEPRPSNSSKLSP